MIMAATGRDNKNSASASPECPICFEARINQRPKKQKVRRQGRLGNGLRHQMGTLMGPLLSADVARDRRVSH